MRRTGMLAMFGLLAFSPLLLAQNTMPQPNPALPADVLGAQLIAWSQLQTPRPMPQPLPPPDRVDPSQPSRATGAQAQQQAPTQTFTGTIVKDSSSSKYVLKVSESTTYQIDDQERAKLYEGKQVKIAGSLDTKSNVLHLVSIEVLS